MTWPTETNTELVLRWLLEPLKSTPILFDQPNKIGVGLRGSRSHLSTDSIFVSVSQIMRSDAMTIFSNLIPSTDYSIKLETRPTEPRDAYRRLSRALLVMTGRYHGGFYARNHVGTCPSVWAQVNPGFWWGVIKLNYRATQNLLGVTTGWRVIYTTWVEV